ncbi:MAG: ATP-binding cassette domain-containing protein [Blastochloris sp.]|mgnify:CR=1 FL=1|jgi:phospholipid/cholesterol/gamma-HCH transport system ATP-binding protein|nr:ATP-binding cassette domain-containing protein [Blastochloris sp.]
MLLEIQHLKKTLNRTPVLKDVNLCLNKGERVVIIGRSGGGKSVLLRHVMGLMQPDEGQVIYQGVNISILSDEEINPYRRKMGMLFQNGALFDSMSVEDNLAFPLHEMGGYTAKEIRLKVAESLEMVDLPGQQNKMPAELSGGMKKRVALARAVINRPELMLYDEPTTGLDPIVADSINRLILRLSDKLGMASIVVTHDMVSAYLIAERICYLHAGKIYFEGTPQQVQSTEDPLVKKFVNGISETSDAVV